MQWIQNDVVALVRCKIGITPAVTWSNAYDTENFQPHPCSVSSIKFERYISHHIL